jgi:AraC family L-rhamnose operon transcriptional activator RhaR
VRSRPPIEAWGELNRAAPVRFTLGSYTAEIQSFGFIPPKPWRNWLHAHTFFEICYAFAGRGRFRMLGVDYPLERGQVFIAKPNEEHEIIADRRDPLGIWFWSFTLVPGGGPGEAAVDRLLRDFIDSQAWVSARAPGMQHTCELLIEEALRREPGHVAAIGGLCAKLVLDTARAAVGPLPGEAAPARAEPPERVLVERARRYILDNLGRPLALHDIAAQTGLSERHLTRLFRRATGASPMAYLAAQRIEAAGQLLLRGVAIKDIAARLGYGDVRYFTTVFRRATGLPPARYRANNGTKFLDPRGRTHSRRR